MSFRFAARQRGAIGLMAALTLGLAVLFSLLVVDSGRLYLEQRKLQRVVDMSALEAAGQRAVCTGTGANALSTAQAAAKRNGFDPAVEHAFLVACGKVSTGAASQRSFAQNNAIAEAIRVIAQREVPSSFASGIISLFKGNGNPTTILQATAVATPPPPPLAALTLRSNLLNVDTNRSLLLNSIFSKMLGGNLSINALGYEGLLGTDISLLDFLDAAKIELKLQAGTLDELLNTDAKLTSLVSAMITAATKAGSTLDVISSLLNLQVASQNSPLVKLGDILNLNGSTPSAGLGATVQLFQLAQALIELASKNSAAAIDLTSVGIPGLLSVTVKARVIQAPQFSDVGDPALAKLNPTGPNQIFVKTAQIRTVLSIKLPLLNAVNGLLTALNGIISPLTGALNSLLHLDLVATIDSVLCLLGSKCDMIDPQVMPGNPSIDVNIEVASANSRVVDYSCKPTKTLTAQTNTAGVVLQVGTITGDAFNPASLPTVAPLPLIDIGIMKCQKILGLGSCSLRTPFAGGGLGLKVDSRVLPNDPGASASQNLLYQPPTSVLLNIGKKPVYLTTVNAPIVGSLKATLAGVKVQAFASPNPNLLSTLLNISASVLTQVNNTLGALIAGLLSPLLDPLLDNVLSLLGVQLNQFEVGANLQCDGRPMLVQ